MRSKGLNTLILITAIMAAFLIPGCSDTGEITASIGDGELSEEDLESVAGGWSWDSFIGGATGGATTAAIGTYAGLTG